MKIEEVEAGNRHGRRRNKHAIFEEARRNDRPSVPLVEKDGEAIAERVTNSHVLAQPVG